MTDSRQPRLVALHSDGSLIALKLAQFEKLSTDALLASLAPGQESCLKTRPDGTIMDGHHRIHLLRGRGIDVDKLAREIIEKKEF